MSWTRMQMAERLVREFQDGWVVNLGVGMPTMIADVPMGDRDIIFHAENGVIGYGAVQASAPKFVRRRAAEGHGEPDGRTAALIAFVLAFFPAAIAIALSAGVDQTFAIIVGLAAFGVIFAINSAVHSYLILSYSHGDKVAMNVGFYYMANAAGRLIGTLLSGLLYQWQGLTACLWASVIFVVAAGLLSLMLPNQRASGSPSATFSSDEAAGGSALKA